MRRRSFPADGRRRVVIEAVQPKLDGGRFPIKRTVGEEVAVWADIFADGHDVLAAALRYRYLPSGPAPQPAERWEETPMRQVDNDRWTGQFTPLRLGRYEYTIEGWVDPFASWRATLVKRVDARQVAESDLQEGVALIRAAASRARSGPLGRPRLQHAASPAAIDQQWLLTQAAALEASDGIAARSEVALNQELLRVVCRYPDRHLATRYDRRLTVLVDRERARFGAWYEMFPRSASPEPGRSATFREAETRLADIAAMGFDVVYLPPIHPIGTTARKGPRNTMPAKPGDPGSPWAIGSPTGGHKAVEPGLGTLDDFDRFLSAARGLGLEVALDLAYQCSPDHPYVREHPEWFQHRPDGTIKHAENPPKIYQDIYPLDFETDGWPALWEELKSIVRFWLDHGVRIFRVDNPHTKPFEFWEWLIAEIRKEYPDVIFLSEAFTRPKVMRRLAKLGFTQSYTYFTWKNTRAELTDYFREITDPAIIDYFRPNLFTNTPDILHAYLQEGGRAAFQVRLMLAATLGASYGIYSGFELCENSAVPGTEEYLGSEKYEYRRWDWDRPGRITELVRRINDIRRTERVLQFNGGLRFHQSDNPQILAYSKSRDRNGLFIVVNLDPHHVQHGWVQVPLTELGLDPGAPYELDDLLDASRYGWTGDTNYVRLDPGERVAHILRPAKQAGG